MNWGEERRRKGREVYVGNYGGENDGKSAL
jgi:hypothetical protein